MTTTAGSTTFEAQLLADESVVAVFDDAGVTGGFVAVTSRRVVVQQNSLAGKRSALVSIPYRSIQTVAFMSNRLGREASSSTVAIASGGQTYEVTLWDDDKARYVHDSILYRIT